LLLKYVNTLMLGVKQQNFEQSQFFFPLFQKSARVILVFVLGSWQGLLDIAGGNSNTRGDTLKGTAEKQPKADNRKGRKIDED